MTVLSDYIAAIDILVQGEIPLEEADKTLAVGMAMKMHSKHSPLIKIQDVTGDGGFDYAVSDLTLWSDGFSVIRSVEYPVDDDDETPDVLQDDRWRIYSKPAGDVLRFLDEKPASDESFRVEYTALHTCTVSACTVKDFDEEAVQALAAAYFCDMLSTYYAQSQDSTIGADAVDHKSKSSEYAARARRYREVYSHHMGIQPGKVPAASVTRDQDKAASWASDKLTHKARYR
jgi:hypothetical protein